MASPFFYSSLCTMIMIMIISLAYRHYYMISPIIFLLIFLYHFTKGNVPLLEIMSPELLLNIHKLHDKVAQALEKRKGTLFVVKGARWLGQRDVLITSDPANIRYIMTAKFSNYVKGSEWKKHFDVFGDHSIFNSDFEDWKWIRKMAQQFLTHHKLHQHIAKAIPNIIIPKGLIPALDRVSENGVVVDLQDLCVRYTFDIASLMATGSNPNSLLSFGLSENVPFLTALDDAFEATFFRHFVPENVWKLQRWLGIGRERILSESWKVIDQFCAEVITTKQEKLDKPMTNEDDDEEGFNLLSCYLVGQTITKPSRKFMRDTITNLIFATQGTTSGALSWFFYLLSKNPLVEIKIREELGRQVKKWPPCNLDEIMNKLVYLHAALCETMRLFPPAPYEWRNPLGSDTLPSGHQVDQNTKILISSYAIGRMASVWGEDCLEFKPERWITRDGGIKYEPPHKFFAFNTGPRTCLGKDIAFNLMKPFVATIIHNYDVGVVEGHPMIPNLSVLLRVKHGLMARIKKRSA